jgi:hypothetical protein
VAEREARELRQSRLRRLGPGQKEVIKQILQPLGWCADLLPIVNDEAAAGMGRYPRTPKTWLATSGSIELIDRAFRAVVIRMARDGVRMPTAGMSTTLAKRREIAELKASQRRSHADTPAERGSEGHA